MHDSPYHRCWRCALETTVGLVLGAFGLAGFWGSSTYQLRPAYTGSGVNKRRWVLATGKYIPFASLLAFA